VEDWQFERLERLLEETNHLLQTLVAVVLEEVPVQPTFIPSIGATFTPEASNG
jgi:hypothetical protein